MAAVKKRGKKEPEEKNTNTPSIEHSLREDAEEQLARSHKISSDLAGQTPEQLIHELQVHQIELEMQAEELRKAHLILEESRNRYIDLYEFAPTGYLTFTDKALITDVNLTAAVLLGVERNEIINHGIGRFIVPTDHEKWDQYFMHVRNRGEKQVCTIMLTRGDGSMFPARLEGVRTSSSDGATTIRIVISDITDIWQIEALKESESFNRSLVESLPDYIVVYGPDGKILYANPATVRAFGYTMEELAGTSVLSYIAPECHDEVTANMAARLDGHDPPDYEMVIIAKDGQRKTVIAKGTLVHYHDGPAILLLLIDITERKRAEEALRMSESKLNAMLQSVADSMSMMDKDLNIIWANETSRQYFGEDLVGRKCYEAYHQRQNPCEPYPCITLRAFHDGKVHRHETTVVDTQGQTHFFECSANVALKDENGEPVAVLEISRDITERKRAEAALKEREQFIQEIIHNAKEGIIVYDRNFNYRVWNPFMESITGISATEALGNNAIDLFPHLKEQKIHILLQRALSGETVQSPDTPYHVPQTRKSGWVSGIYSPHFNDQGVIVGVIGIIHDITDWKKADDALRESEGTFKALAENANDGILVAVTEEAHTYANRRVCEMLGYSVTELQKSSIKDLVVPDEAATLIERFRKRLLGEDIPQQYVTSLLHKDGKNVPVEISAAKTSWHGQPADLVIIHDITERKRAEKTIRHALAEREVLLREIHHRVKNNLASIISLIGLQVASLSDPTTIFMLRDLETRIQSMALVHESLYLSEDLARINFGNYTEKLTRHLFDIYVTGAKIRCRIEMGDVTMPIETAIPCGLVMTEIITNSLKYAFPKTFSCKEIRGKSCSITLTLRREDSNYLLNIADNGIGIPERTDVTVTRTLGLYLIKLIVQHQLRGTLDISTDRGTSYTIRFPEPAVKGWEDR